MHASIGTGSSGSGEVARPDLSTSLFALIAYFGREATVNVFDTVDALELTTTQIRVLHHLDEIDTELSVKEAAEFAMLSLGAISRSLDGLVRRGFIERREDPTDRRMKRIRISDDGRTAIRGFEAVNRSVIDRFLETLPAADQEQLAKALAPLLERPEISACLPPAFVPQTD